MVKIDELPRAVKVEDCADLESCLDRADPTASSVPVKDVHSSFSACSDSSVIPPKPSHNRDRAFYCPFTVLPEMTSLAGEILDKLVFYQDRAYKQDPQLYKRRFICGFKVPKIRHIIQNNRFNVIWSHYCSRSIDRLI